MPIKQKVPVNERALIARINRKLIHEGKSLKRARGTRVRSEFGDFYVVKGSGTPQYIVRAEVQLEKFAKELGVLAEWERLAEN